MIICVLLDSTYKDTSCSLGKIVFPNFQSCTTIVHIECICTIIYHFNNLTIIMKSNLYTLCTDIL